MKDSMKLSDLEYGKVLDNIVVGCVDVAVIYQGKILLEKRDKDPIQGHWWIFGGRVLVGENLKSTAQRGVQRELNVYIDDLNRFVQFGVYNLVWPTRREPKQENGCHHLLIAHLVSLTGLEYKKINDLIDNSPKYSWFDLEENKLFLPELNEIVSKIKSTI